MAHLAITEARSPLQKLSLCPIPKPILPSPIRASRSVISPQVIVLKCLAAPYGGVHRTIAFRQFAPPGSTPKAIRNHETIGLIPFCNIDTSHY
jgi:hypothetical protein